MCWLQRLRKHAIFSLEGPNVMATSVSNDKRLFLVATCFAVGTLSACASMVLESYVGKSLLEPVLDYGAPSDAFDMSGNRRAFIWNRNVSGVISGSSYTDSSVNIYGDFVNVNSYTHTTPSQYYSYDCSYVLIAEKTREDTVGPEAWTITEYRNPRLECE